MKYILDGRKMITKEDTHIYLKEIFGFPAYYGKNLDALYDSLMELGKLEVEWIYEDVMLESLGNYGKKIFQVFEEMKVDGIKNGNAESNHKKENIF